MASKGYIQILEDAAQDALLILIENRTSILNKHKSFANLKSNAADLNSLLGFSFKEIVAGRVLREAAKERVNLQRFQIDGIDQLPSGIPTPQHLDLVFLDTDSNIYYSFKLMYSPKNVQDMIVSFYNKHGSMAATPQLPQSLEVANTQIIVPKGFEKRIDPVPVKVIDPATGKLTDQNIIPKSTIRIGYIKVEVPSCENLEQLLEQNFATVKHIIEEGFVVDRKVQMRSIKQLQERIDDQKARMTEIKNELKIENTKRQLDECHKELQEAEKYLEDVEKAIEKELRSVQSTDSKLVLWKQKKNMIR